MGSYAVLIDRLLSEYLVYECPRCFFEAWSNEEFNEHAAAQHCDYACPDCDSVMGVAGQYSVMQQHVTHTHNRLIPIFLNTQLNVRYVPGANPSNFIAEPQAWLQRLWQSFFQLCEEQLGREE